MLWLCRWLQGGLLDWWRGGALMGQGVGRLVGLVGWTGLVLVVDAPVAVIPW